MSDTAFLTAERFLHTESVTEISVMLREETMASAMILYFSLKETKPLQSLLIHRRMQ